MTHTATLTPNNAGLDSVEAKENPVPSAVKNEIKKVIPHASLPTKITSASSIIRLSPPSYYQQRKNLPTTLQNRLKDHFIRYRNNPHLRLKPVTICIAGICNTDVSPMVLFCADRLVSTEIQFEGGSSKIMRITLNGIIMETSSDSASSELVIERLRQKIDQKKQYTIKELAEMLAQECISFRTETLDRQVVSKYNVVIEKLHADPNTILKEAVNELRFHPYPFFEFIVCGLDNPSGEAHIYTVDQEGNLKLWDFLGFSVIGSGGQLAFSEMTKYTYSNDQPVFLAIPRIYFAKKASERAQGVGKVTDYGFLYLKKTNSGVEASPFFISTDPDLMKLLEDGYSSLQKSEIDTITNIQKTLQTKFDEANKKHQKDSKSDKPDSSPQQS